MPHRRMIAAILCLIGAAAWFVKTCDRATPKVRPPKRPTVVSLLSPEKLPRTVIGATDTAGR
jgi:hypothetical protein